MIKYDIKSAVLKSFGIKLADFLQDGYSAVYDAASDIGSGKGYGSEGIGELASEIWQELGVESDDEENLGCDDCLFTIDGKLPDRKKIEIDNLKAEIKNAKARLKKMETELAKLIKAK